MIDGAHSRPPPGLGGGCCQIGWVAFYGSLHREGTPRGAGGCRVLCGELVFDGRVVLA